jgi:hypothetical protein
LKITLSSVFWASVETLKLRNREMATKLRKRPREEVRMSSTLPTEFPTEREAKLAIVIDKGIVFHSFLALISIIAALRPVRAHFS